MASQAPLIQPAFTTHHVNRGLGLLLVGLVVIVVAVAALLVGPLFTAAPRAASGVDEFPIALRQSEKSGLMPAAAIAPRFAPTIYYSASSALSGVHGPLVPPKPSVYYSAASALSGVHGPAAGYVAPSVYYSAASALSGVHGPAAGYVAPSVYYSASSAGAGILIGNTAEDRGP